MQVIKCSSVDIDKKEDWTQQFPKVDVVISYLASRSKERQLRRLWFKSIRRFACKVQHFILLSAICIQKPKLAFQYEKLRFQNELIASGLRYSIVLPTTFFKSLSSQINRISRVNLLVFDGPASSLPISETDLARYISNCIVQKEFWNKSPGVDLGR